MTSRLTRAHRSARHRERSRTNGERKSSMFARRLALFILALAVEVRGGETKAESVELNLGVGEQRVLATDGVRSYSEGVPGVVDVRLTKDARQFVVVGQHPGATSLLFMLEGGAERQ